MTKSKNLATILVLLLPHCLPEVSPNDLGNGANFSDEHARRNSRQDPEVIPPKSSLAKRQPPSERILMSGGPSNPCPSVWEAMQTHASGVFEDLTTDTMDEVVEGLRYVFQTRNNLTFPITGSGAAGMATVLKNLVENGDKVVVGVNGYWGTFAAVVAERLGAQVTRLEKSAGQVFSLRELRLAVKRVKPDVLYLVHGVSSTGAYQPLHGVGDLCREFGCLLVADVVASIASVPLFIDAWKVDAAFANSQKAIGSIVGLAPVTFSNRAWERYKQRKTIVADRTKDLEMLGAYWTPLTPSSRALTYSMALQQLYGMREGLYLVAKETLPRRWSRVALMSNLLTTQFQPLGITPFVTKRKKRLLSTMTYNLPPNVNVTTLTEFALKKYNLDLGHGLYQAASNTLRVGLFACNAVIERVEFVVKVVAEGVQQQRLGASSR